jgi:hypothetical protein
MNTKLRKTYRTGCLIGALVWIAIGALVGVAAQALGDPLLPWVSAPGVGEIVWNLSTAGFIAGAVIGVAATFFYLVFRARVPGKQLLYSLLAVLALLVIYAAVALRALGKTP